MTPKELLEDAKSHFTVLYYKDTTDLNRILKKSLGKYQEKAGSIGIVKVVLEDDGSIDVPEDLLDIMAAVDDNTRYIDCSVENNKIVVSTDDETTYPVKVHYFHNLRDWDAEKALPVGISSLLLDYVIALIDVQNTERERGVMAATEQQIELPTRQELTDKASMLEEAMEESKSIGIPVAVW